MTNPDDAMLGTLAAGRYRILKLLGEGGMGQVYLAEHVAIEKRVALKILRAEFAAKGDIVTRFQQEAISASRIKHPNVLDVFDFGQLENGRFFLAMEFLEGNDLADELSRRRVLDAASGIRISMQMCRALAAAHANGVVHRDMKPENVFLQRTGDGEEIVKIVDFGIAQLRSKDAEIVQTKRRLTRTGMIFGTPEYMAPEQAGGKHADPRSDIYSVGIIMYEMFTGAVPFTGDTFLGVLAKHLSDPTPLMTTIYPDVSVSSSLQGVIMRALEKDPTVRFQTMLDFAQAISASTDAAALGYRPIVPVPSENPTSFAAHAPGNPTQPQFSPSAPSTTSAIISHGPGRGRDTEAARAETLIGAEASARAPGPRSKRPVIAALLGLVVLVGGGAWILSHRGETTRPAPEPAAALPSLPVAPAAIAPGASAVALGTPAASVEATVAPTAGIHLAVTTEPSGAILLKNGFQVCDQTPCDVVASPAENVEFQAQKGPLRGSAKVLAQRDQKVTIKLQSAAVAGGAKPAAQRLCEVEVDGLKILRACK
ncbi:MAG TPA: serine/threonine-protein kinase [Polyangiaceae bacterium]|nr:serine/threonine-protein kinase [Polyangiaceae bacterium]